MRRVSGFSSGSPVEDSVVESIRCPECRRPATLVVRVLEVPGDLLCARCLRAPADEERLVYPDIYEQMADEVPDFPAEVLDRIRR